MLMGELSQPFRIAAIMTCHNRREKTLSSLGALREAADSEPRSLVSVFLTDDGSSDGTADAVLALPLEIWVIEGDGSLFWNRGTLRSWRAAHMSRLAFDAFLLLNDDTVLDSQALTVLLDTHLLRRGAIVVGATRDATTGELTYGGVRRTSRWHPGKFRLLPELDRVQEADAANANCMLVPRQVVESVGMLDPVFTHGIGDYDYGLRAKRIGVPTIVAPGTVGACSRNDLAGTWLDNSLPLRHRLRLLESPRGLPRREWFEYLRRHGTPLPWLVSWFPTLQVLRTSCFRSRSTGESTD